MNDVSPRSGVLQEAIGLIDGDRNAQYGPPTQDFQRTADILNSLGYSRFDPERRIVEIVPSDVAILVMAVKLSRLMHSRGKRDNWVDLAGYAGCGFECTQEEETYLQVYDQGFGQRMASEVVSELTAERNDFQRKFEHEMKENLRLTRELAEAKHDAGFVVLSSYAGEPVNAADA